jgi:hypothetical protein
VGPHDGVHRVARGAGLGGDDEPLLAQEPVDQGGLADVRPPDDGHVDRVVQFPGLRHRESLHDGVEQVAARLADGRRERDRIAETQLVERQVGGGVGEVVELVDRQQHRALGPAQLGGDLGVHGVESLFPVHQQHHQVRLFHRELHLVADGPVHRVGGVGHQPPGVHQPEAPPAPFGGAEMPVPRGAGLVGDDRLPPPDETVEQGGLPDVRAPHQGYGRHAHAGTGAASASVK